MTDNMCNAHTPNVNTNLIRHTRGIGEEPQLKVSGETDVAINKVGSNET